MSDEGAPKSALEIAMARLRQKDAESGATDVPLTDEQRARIAEVRQAAEAKLAQADIMFKASLATTFDPEARATLEGNHRRDVQRINDDRERKVGKVRAGTA